jgi:hypothetical protein
MSTSTLILMRHAEKPDADIGSQGVDELGRHDPQALSVRGWQRAGALVRLLAPADVAHAVLPRPTALCAAAPSRRHPSRRPALTLQPLANELDLPINQSCGADDEPAAVAQALLAEAGVILVSWRHDELPSLARALAVAAAPDLVAHIPPEWPDDRYDLLWLLDRRGGAWRFRQQPQLLLPGDLTDTIH